jgi:serine/threonine-protein kinase
VRYDSAAFADELRALAEPTHDSPKDEWLDVVVDGRYRVLERIGHGGMGAVYKVVHTQINKIAAMKLLHSSLVGDKELLKRFHREAEAISRLSHPNIVQVFDFGRVGDTAYVVMEYLKGEDLGTILRRDGPIEIGRAAPILIQVCDALTEAHEMRIIHRDLKPENVRVSRTKDGADFVKVLDFGLAKMLEEEKDLSITAQGNLVGTPYYMAPELIRAEPIDHRCDIYSLGAMAYRMLTGENAFTAKTPVGVLTKHITDDLTPPSERAPEQRIAREVDVVVLKAMAKDRAVRYQTAQELKQDLIDILEKLPPAERPSGPLRPRDSHAGLVITPRQNRRDSDPTGPSHELAFSPTGRIDESDIPSPHPVLSKDDLAFERGMKRGGALKLLLVLPLLAAIGFAIYWFGFRRGELYASGSELEPNNSPDRATPIRADAPVTGHLGQRVSSTESDRDWYVLQVSGSAPQWIRAEVSAIPNMDLTLELYDAAAGKMTGADSLGRGGGEQLVAWPVDPGKHYLLVREVWQVGTPPTENVTDAYRLTMSWRQRESGWELEPNDTAAKAGSLRAPASLRGYLATVEDQDLVKIEGPAGKLALSVSGIAGADLVLELAPLGAEAARTVDEQGAGGGEKAELEHDGTAARLVTLRRKSREKLAAGPTSHGGFDLPYTLKVEPVR